MKSFEWMVYIQCDPYLKPKQYCLWCLQFIRNVCVHGISISFWKSIALFVKIIKNDLLFIHVWKVVRLFSLFFVGARFLYAHSYKLNYDNVIAVKRALRFLSHKFIVRVYREWSRARPFFWSFAHCMRHIKTTFELLFRFAFIHFALIWLDASKYFAGNFHNVIWKLSI